VDARAGGRFGEEINFSLRGTLFQIISGGGGGGGGIVVVVVIIVTCFGDVYCDLLSTRAAVLYESVPRLHLVLCAEARVGGSGGWRKGGGGELTRVRKVAGSMSGPGICFCSFFFL
jgi:hypothetical protein